MPVSEKVLHRLINLGEKRKAQKHKKQEEQKQKQALLLESQNSSNWPTYRPNGSWQKLKSEKVTVIHKLYCRDCQMEEKLRQEQQLKKKQEEQEGALGAPSPSAVTLEEMSIQEGMDKNKESLKKKLLLRRPINELVDRGIYPPLKTPPAFAEQRRQLERAKAGDLLRHKIQTRPNRQSLVEQNILQDSTAHPTIQEKQKQLKRARLLDGLNDRISQRPGPLELVEENILQSNELHEALVEGKVQYNRTCEGEDPDRPVHFLFDEESISDGVPSPPQALESEFSQLGSVQSSSALSPISDVSGSSFQVSPVAQAKAIGQYAFKSLAQPSLQSSRQSAQQPTPSSSISVVVTSMQPIITNNSYHSHMTTIPSPTNSISSVSSTSSCSSRSGSLGSLGKPSSQRVKKVRLKGSSKNKVIKFHEYKGPPSVVKSQPPIPPPDEADTTPYNILLQQQQMFLEWQRELQKGNQLPSGPMGDVSPISSSTPTPVSSLTPTSTTPSPIAQPVQLPTSTTPSVKKTMSVLDDLKVADLKAELKKRNLTVSGTKPQLIERLRPFAHEIVVRKSPQSPQQYNTPSQPLRLQLDTSPVHSASSVKSSIARTPPTPINDDTNMSFLGHYNTSPPLSPVSDYSSISVPMSPDTMDMSHITSFPSNIQQEQDKMEASTRPSSVVPMDVDIGHAGDAVNVLTNVTLDLNNLAQLNGLLNNNLHLPQQHQIITNIGAPKLLTQDDLVRMQQRQIEDLQRQLKVSQLQLQLQQQLQQQIDNKSNQTMNMLQQSTSLMNPNQYHHQSMIHPSSQSLIIHAAPAVQQQAVSTSSTPVSTISTRPISSTSVQNQQQVLHDGLNQQQRTAGQQQQQQQQQQARVVQLAALPQSFIITPSGTARQHSTTARQHSTTPSNGNTLIKSPNSLPSSPTKSQLNGRLVSMSTKEQMNFSELKQQTSHRPKFQPPQQQQQQVQPSSTSYYTSNALNNQNSTLTTAQQQQQQQQSTKCQAMDDVLDILIKCGELPPSAAVAPMTPRRRQPMTTTTPPHQKQQRPSAAISGRQSSVHDTVTSSVNSSRYMTQLHDNLAGSPSPGKRSPPPPLTINSSINSSSPSSSDLSRLINDQFTSDDLNSFVNMEWASSDNGLELDLSHSPRPSSTSVHGSDSSLMHLGLSDHDQGTNMNIDISDWLDVIMPNNAMSTTLTPISANFPSDPILTPKPEDVMDLFNMKETDFNNPTDPNSGLTWDRIAELTKS